MIRFEASRIFKCGGRVGFEAIQYGVQKRSSKNIEDEISD